MEGDSLEETRACRTCGVIYPLVTFHRSTKGVQGRDSRCLVCKQKSRAKAYATSYWNVFCTNKRSECKGKAIPYDLTPEYLRSMWTGRCPILGCAIVYGHRMSKDLPDRYKAELDRIDPAKGYTIGNVAWVSSRANRVKLDATEEELELILKYMRQHKLNTKGEDNVSNDATN